MTGGTIARGLTLAILVCTAAAAVEGADAVATDGAASPLAWTPEGRPRWVASPHVPLAGTIEAATTLPATLSVRLTDGVTQREIPAPADAKASHSLPVLELRPDREYTLTVAARAGEAMLSETLRVTTPPLPPDFPTLEVLAARPGRVEPGVTMCTVLRWQNSFASLDVGWFIALDAEGAVVWYLRMPEPAGAIRRLTGGNFLLIHGARPTGLREIDPLGNVVRQYRAIASGIQPEAGEIPVDVDTFHHDVLPLPSGNWLALTTEVRRIADFPASESRPSQKQPANVVGDVIVEVRPDGSVAGRWKLLDLLDPTRIGYGSLDSFWDLRAYPFVFGGTKDWSHSNSLAYDPTDDSLLVCLRHQDAVVKIDRQSSRVKWILGDKAGWRRELAELVLTPEDDSVWPYHAHAVEYTPEGRLLLFDNGNHRAIPPRRPQSAAVSYSRALELEVDEDQRTVRRLWSYGEPGPGRFFSAFVGSADWLAATGNVLICDGGRLESRTGAPLGIPPAAVQWGRVLEVTRDTPAETVFEVRFSEPGRRNGWGSSIYRAERLPTLYPGE